MPKPTLDVMPYVHIFRLVFLSFFARCVSETWPTCTHGKNAVVDQSVSPFLNFHRSCQCQQKCINLNTPTISKVLMERDIFFSVSKPLFRLVQSPAIIFLGFLPPMVQRFLIFRPFLSDVPKMQLISFLASTKSQLRTSYGKCSLFAEHGLDT